MISQKWSILSLLVLMVSVMEVMGGERMKYIRMLCKECEGAEAAIQEYKDCMRITGYNSAVDAADGYGTGQECRKAVFKKAKQWGRSAKRDTAKVDACYETAKERDHIFKGCAEVVEAKINEYKKMSRGKKSQ